MRMKHFFNRVNCKAEKKLREMNTKREDGENECLNFDTRLTTVWYSVTGENGRNDWQAERYELGWKEKKEKLEKDSEGQRMTDRNRNTREQRSVDVEGRMG